jgi:cell pole-organizing protein PopZ
MAETTEASADPSMEEILASIRKIISDEVPPEAVTAAEEPVVEAAAPPAAAEAPQEEVLELTQMVQDDGSLVDLTEAVEEPQPIPPPPVVAAPPAPPLPPAEPLVSQPAAETAASALSSLANTVEIERLSSSPAGATYVGNGGRTLEDMTIELMRPLLKDWLDRNLPAVVERLVQKEIERIARRS